MMISVAVAALGCAAVPFLVVDPVSTLVVAAAAAAIPAVILRGRHKPILIGAVSLACLATLAASVQESRTLWRDATLYRQLANRHANRRQVILGNFSYLDRQYRTATGATLDHYKDIRRQMLAFAEHDAKMSERYDRAARRPWTRVEPEPEPRPPQPSAFDSLFILDIFSPSPPLPPPGGGDPKDGLAPEAEGRGREASGERQT
jgi:hypothetical protein